MLDHTYGKPGQDSEGFNGGGYDSLLVLFIAIVIIALVKVMKSPPKRVGDTSLLLLMLGIMFGLWFRR